MPSIRRPFLRVRHLGARSPQTAAYVVQLSTNPDARPSCAWAPGWNNQLVSSVPSASTSLGLSRASDELERALFEVKKVIVGQDRMVERMMTCLLARGHCL